MKLISVTLYPDHFGIP